MLRQCLISGSKPEAQVLKLHSFVGGRQTAIAENANPPDRAACLDFLRPAGVFAMRIVWDSAQELERFLHRIGLGDVARLMVVRPVLGGCAASGADVVRAG
jgi:hypothetical protein